MAKIRQLALPGLAGPRQERRLRPRRDLTRAAFLRAIERLGFRPQRGGAAFVAESRDVTVRVQAIVRRDPVRLDRRATLAAIARAAGFLHP